jgi:hypothetical protein
VGFRAGLDAVAKRKESQHCPVRKLNPVRPARSIVYTEPHRLCFVLGCRTNLLVLNESLQSFHNVITNCVLPPPVTNDDEVSLVLSFSRVLGSPCHIQDSQE